MSITPIDPKLVDQTLIEKAINTIRFLAVDAVEKANSGHPGAPMGMAAIAAILWTKFLKFDPSDPNWIDRDRFVLSNGHASMLLYSMLHLTGYDLSVDDLKHFRQWGSKTPGHPERGITPGVEVTTGPLGQGFANAVGMAAAEAHLAALLSGGESPLIDHHTYVFVGDGCMMEGITSEAASLAGHLRLGKLICFYDDNGISIDGKTNITFTEDLALRFKAYNWQVLTVENGNDTDQITRATEAAQHDTKRPSMIICKTHIGFGSPNKQDTAKAHGSPLGKEEVELTKKNLGWPDGATFFIPEEVKAMFEEAGKRGTSAHEEWKKSAAKHPDSSKLKELLRGDTPEWSGLMPDFGEAPVATRVASGKILNAIAKKDLSLLGGSADLNESTFTHIDSAEDFQPKATGLGDFAGRTINFGVREHAMAAMTNGIAAHGGLRPFCSTFFTFSDYMRPSVRLSALMDVNSLFIWTHDSVGLGEDGPTHQPVEHLMSLRIIPNLTLFRPADANETAAAWSVLQNMRGPVGLVLSRQKLPVLKLDTITQENLSRGAYVISDAQNLQAILIASGSEVSLAIDAQKRLADSGLNVRVVSMPSWDRFAEQSEEYQKQILPDSIPARLSIELGVTTGWERWIGPGGASLGIDHFGASAPYEEIMKHFGFTVENVASIVKQLISDPEAARRSLRSASQKYTHGHISSAPAAGDEGHS